MPVCHAPAARTIRAGRNTLTLRRPGGSTPPPPAFSPSDLSPALWIDPSDAATVTISGSSGAYIGPNGLVSPSSGSNYTSTPSHAGIQVTGDIDVRAYLTVADWTPATLNYVLIKYAGAGGKGYGLRLEIGGKIGLYYGTGAERLDQSTVANTLTDGTAGWIRATHATGSGQTNFYQSTDGTNWTQIGTTVAGTAGALGTDTASLIIGSSTGTNNTAGTIHRVKILDGIDGTAVFDADFESATAYVSAFTESALGAPVYVVSSTATSSTANYGYVGPLGLVLPGSGANSASAVDSAALSITGDIEFQAKLTAVDWTPAALMRVLSKGNGSTDSYQLGIDTTGAIKVTVYDGSGYTSWSSSVGTGLADGATKWIKATIDLSNGSNSVATFYLSDDGSSWTQLGTTVTGSIVSAISDNGIALSIGVTTGSSSPWCGTISRVKILNGIGGTTAFDADFAGAADYCTSFTESSSNAATVTITATNTPANAAGACVSQINDKSGNARHLTQGTLANMPKYWNGQNGNNVLVFDGTNDLMRTASAITNSAPFGSLAVVQLGASPGANIYVWDSHTTAADVLMSTRTTTSVRIFAGTNLSAVQAVPGRRDIWAAKFDGASSTLRVNGAQVAAGNAGASVHELLTLGAMADGTANWWKGTVGEVIFWPSPSSFTDVESYASTKWGTP